MTQNRINTLNPVIQVVTSSTTSVVNCTTNMPYDDTIPQSTEGTQVLTASITPKFSTSLLQITFMPGAYFWSSAGSICAALFQDSTAAALSAKGWTPSVGASGYFEHFMTSGTTSSTTFKIRAGGASATSYINAKNNGTRMLGGSCLTILKIVEYMQ